MSQLAPRADASTLGPLYDDPTRNIRRLQLIIPTDYVHKRKSLSVSLPALFDRYLLFGAHNALNDACGVSQPILHSPSASATNSAEDAPSSTTTPVTTYMVQKVSSSRTPASWDTYR